MNNKVLYIYGYGSSPESSTYKWLKENLEDSEVFCVKYDQSDPENSIPFLCEFVKNNNIKVIIGSSFGGWYALHVAGRTSRACILINPLTDKNLEEVLVKVGMKQVDTILNFQKTHPLFIDNNESWALWDSVENGCNSYAILGRQDLIIPYNKQDISKYVHHVATVNSAGHQLTDEEKSVWLNRGFKKVLELNEKISKILF